MIGFHKEQHIVLFVIFSILLVLNLWAAFVYAHKGAVVMYLITQALACFTYGEALRHGKIVKSYYFV